MKVLLKQARIISSSSAYHRQVKDILIIDGIISEIADKVTSEADQVISRDNLHVSIGWMDLFAHFNDPGNEQKETLQSGAAAAAAGGFTDVMIIPNNNPAISTKGQVEYILQKASTLPVNIHPIGSISKNAEGKELAEMYDMYNSGAKAFSDGTQPVQSPGMLTKALQYVLAIDAPIFQLPDDKSLSAHGLMHEGVMSTRLGLPGNPAIAEELMIARDIELLKYSRSKLHITGVSTRRGIELIKAARKEGLSISCSITPNHCFFCDEDLAGYDTNLKMNPPLRSTDDRLALREALLAGDVDAIASHHMPQHWDDKTCEFEYAKNGAIGLQTVFGVMNNFGLTLDQFINMLTLAPRKIVGLTIPEIKIDTPACITLFDPEGTYTFEQSMIRSLSHNSPFIGKSMKGTVIGIIHKNQTIIHA